MFYKLHPIQTVDVPAMSIEEFCKLLGKGDGPRSLVAFHAAGIRTLADLVAYEKGVYSLPWVGRKMEGLIQSTVAEILGYEVVSR